jgi:TPP-dependent pyruvate/acetoin dehydrogenase alpha subunit
VKEDGPTENPLISNGKLRQIYTAMVHARIFAKILATRSGNKSEFKALRGQEACHVSSLIDLKEGDLVSSSTVSPVIDLILGAELKPLLLEVKKRPSNAQGHKRAIQLSSVKNPEDRITLALGAALSLKAIKQGNVAVAFVQRGEVSKSAWKKALSLAHKLELPIIFVVLPGKSVKKSSSTPEICGVARSIGVPGIPVDATDAVASYRVIQESLGRTRGGDGPVVIECLAYRLSEGKLVKRDPVLQMEDVLRKRKIASKAWTKNVAASFEKRVAR